MVIGAAIVIGTSKGLTLVFDYNQSLVATIGLGTKAVESGSVTALSISADHSIVASGHATGHIFTWEVARPAKPFLQILPLTESQLEHQRADGPHGHVLGSAVVHLGFLGTRHTALVSADNCGMAFSHLATRGLGAVARVVKSARILGRYPSIPPAVDRPRKPSSVLAFSSLPLGNVAHPTDSFGLTAILTPYLLVVVSTTPIAETQHKSPRPKEIPPHSTLSGCLAWFPAVKLKRPDPGTRHDISKTKLVYCWSHILTVLDVEAETFEEKDKPPVLHFQPRSRWRGEEAIVAVQWLSRSVLAVLTISQRLIILEDNTLRVTDNFDLIQKHIYHQDVFSAQLRPVVENLDEEDASMHGVVADAFYMSFRTYKQRLFLLGFNDVSIGTLSNWADRLTALLEDGDFLEAIKLAESYYVGNSDKITVGLPEDNETRHSMVLDKLKEMIRASLSYVFKKPQSTGDTSLTSQHEIWKELALASFSACLATQELDFLFEDVFEAFQAAGGEEIFFSVLEPHIVSEEIQSMPTIVLKELIQSYASEDRAPQLENLICHMDTRTMDLDQTATLCKKFRLYDALTHVWTQAIGDYVTPLVEFMKLEKVIEASNDDESEDSEINSSANRVFPYLANVLTGRSYPRGLELDDADAYAAKKEVYRFLLSGKAIEWPPGSKKLFSTVDADEDEPQYPYLSLILRFDAPSFLSVLNEAFEDHFLNGAASSEQSPARVNGNSDHSLLPTRQSIIGILLGVMRDDFDAEDSVYLDMFIARNLPKFPQFIILSGNVLDGVIQRLCDYPSEELADDCQLSVEYLLSYYRPSNIENLTTVFRQAGFFRILKSVYKNAKQYAQLVQTFFEDPHDKDKVFDCISDCLRPGSSLTPKQVKEVHGVILKHARDLVAIDSVKAALTLAAVAPELLQPIFDSLDAGSYVQFNFLKSLLEPTSQQGPSASSEDEKLHGMFEEKYVQLMCRYQPNRVADYISVLKSGDLRLQEVLPAMESTGAIDAAVLLLARDGLVTDAMKRLKAHLLTLGNGLTTFVKASSESPDLDGTTEAVESLLADVHKYVKVGIWMCQGQTKAASKYSKNTAKEANGNKKLLDLQDAEADLSLDELLWLELVAVIVDITKDVSLAVKDMPATAPLEEIGSSITSSLRSSVQDCFTALLNATARPTLPADTGATLPSTQPHPAFLMILRAFLSRVASSSPSLSDLRAVLAEIFQAYAFEERILDLANQFLDKDLFQFVEDAWIRRQKGWRPRGNVCEGCGKRVWGPGVGGTVWDQWESSLDKADRAKLVRRKSAQGDADTVSEGRGKGKASDGNADASEPSEPGDGTETEPKPDVLQPLVVFACRHIWHRDCLERSMAEHGLSSDGDGRALRCTAGHTLS
jgi:hypothetical protein